MAGCIRCLKETYGPRAKYCAAHRKVVNAERNRAYHELNRERIRVRNSRWNKANPEKYLNGILQREYGITVEEYRAMEIQQGGKCFICKSLPKAPRRRLSVDHDHSTGKVRRLLCSRCNTLLGLVKDDPNLLDDAASYLRRS